MRGRKLDRFSAFRDSALAPTIEVFPLCHRIQKFHPDGVKVTFELRSCFSTMALEVSTRLPVGTYAVSFLSSHVERFSSDPGLHFVGWEERDYSPRM